MYLGFQDINLQNQRIARTIVNKINILYDNIETFAITNIVESFYVLTDRNREIKLVLIEHQSSPFP